MHPGLALERLPRLADDRTATGGLRRQRRAARAAARGGRARRTDRDAPADDASPRRPRRRRRRARASGSASRSSSRQARGRDLRSAAPTSGHAPDGHVTFVVDGTVVLHRGRALPGRRRRRRRRLERSARSVHGRAAWSCPTETRVLPGHTDETTIGREWEENPFVRYWRGADPEGHGEPVRVGGARRRSSSGRPTTTARARRSCGSRTGARRSSAARGVERAREPPSSRDEIERYAEEHTTRPTELLARLAEETRATLELPADAHRPGRGPASSSCSSSRRGRGACSSSARTAATRRSRWRRRCRPAGRSTRARSTSGTRRSRAATSPRAGYADRITVHLGPGARDDRAARGRVRLRLHRRRQGQLPAHYEAVLPRLAERGLIAVDNTLWSGRVVDEPGRRVGGDARHRARSTNTCAERPARRRACMLTVRDGVTLIRRAA